MKSQVHIRINNSQKIQKYFLEIAKSLNLQLLDYEEFLNLKEVKKTRIERLHRITGEMYTSLNNLQLKEIQKPNVKGIETKEKEVEKESPRTISTKEDSIRNELEEIQKKLASL